MWEFSEMCKSLIQNSNMSIYKIAKLSGLERTALNRMVNGKRLLNQDDFEKFCDAVRMGKRDRERLSELYMIEKIGKRKYENQKYILKILRYLDSLGGGQQKEKTSFQRENMQQKEGEKEKIQKMPPENIILDSCIVGKASVKALLHKVLRQAIQKEDSTIYTNIPASHTDLFEEMEYLCSIYHRKMKVCHYFMLLSSPENYYNSNYNLEILSNILPQIFSASLEYYPYYTYSNSMLEDMTNTIMSYFLVTDDYVVQFTQDMDSVIIHHERAVVELYHERIEQECQSNMHHLLPEMPKTENISQRIGECIGRVGDLTYCLVSPVHKRLEKGSNTFTEAGLKHFYDTGSIWEPVDACHQPIPIPQRETVLKELLDGVRCGEIDVRIAGHEIPMLLHISLELYKQGIQIRICREQNLYKGVFLSESSICESFRDFLDAMIDMKLAQDREGTLKILETYSRAG